jgi:hypothetical protein
MNNKSDYFQHHLRLIKRLNQYCQQQLPFCDDKASDVDIAFIEELEELSRTVSPSDEFQYSGQHIISRIVGHYPHITPEVNRDLFWFFGGECLHYMGDDEITLYQQLEEFIHEPSNNTINYAQAKASVFQLH